MKPGPNVARGIALAIPFALWRGHVMVFIPSLLNLGEFLLSGNGLFVIVRVRLARKLSAGIASIEREFAEVIAGLRLVPRNGPVSCELWLYSRYGTLRHFRIGDDGLVEIDRYGMPLNLMKPVVTGPPPRGDSTVMPYETNATSPASPGTAAPRDPILRWLAKKNAAKKAGTGTDAMGSNELKKILDAGIPKTKSKHAPGKKPVIKNQVPAGPVDPENSTGTEKPVAGANKNAGKKAVTRKTGGAALEERAEPERPVLGETPALPAAPMSAPEEQSPDHTVGSTGAPGPKGDLR